MTDSQSHALKVTFELVTDPKTIHTAAGIVNADVGQILVTFGDGTQMVLADRDVFDYLFNRGEGKPTDIYLPPVEDVKPTYGPDHAESPEDAKTKAAKRK